ncbi:hypothetical protein ABEB36_003313 [Hypothenemus hampei]|uniref:DNA-directed RNA polymerase I subunit RPA49 n=1 Tax=Hypothenemus hampei TaxID=57062 RepID=A0ABD1FBW1_HYPHA
MPKIRKINIETTKPILIDFQNGKLKREEECLFEAAVFNEKNSNKKLVGVTNKEMIYSGHVTNNNDYNTFLAVKTESGIELIQLDTCIVAPLLDKTLVNRIFNSTKKTHTLGDLRKQFGSKKAKRFTEQQEKLAMNVENVKEHLEKTVQDISVPDIALNFKEVEGDSFYKPKINRNATSKEDVYELSDLVALEVLDSLEQRIQEVLEKSDLSGFNLMPIIHNNILLLRSSSFPENVILQRCEVLLYVDYLIKFTLTPVRSMTKKFIACDCSSEVDKYLKSNFMINGTRPVSMKDKCLCYILVLLMLVMNYNVDLEPLSKDMKIGIKKLQEFARNLGFSQSATRKTNIVLKIPVPPPIVPNLKRKRK